MRKHSLTFLTEDTVLQRACSGRSGLLFHICSLIGVLLLPLPSCGKWKLQWCSVVGASSQSGTQGTNVNEILWISSSAAVTAVINRQVYFQATLVRFTQPWSDLVWVEPLCRIWLRDCTTNIQQDEPVNYSSHCSAPHPLNRHVASKCPLSVEQSSVRVSQSISLSIFIHNLQLHY